MNNHMEFSEIENKLFGDFEILEKEEEEMPAALRLKNCVLPLLNWYHKNARILPWREDPSPYHVWISEIMLQQTRVEAVKEYYRRFLDALPQVKDLAEADDEKLLKLWEGLGYYSRVRNLKKAAIKVMEKYGGEVPKEEKDLRSLPGIGSYTCGAVASIAYGIRIPAVDGNVLRVISRITADERDILKESTKKEVDRMLREIMPEEEPGTFNQALMELGALVCVPNGEPHCTECPLKGLCLAKRRGITGKLPVKTPKKSRKIQERTILVITDGVRVMIRKRPEEGLLAGLYEFPGTDFFETSEEAEKTVCETAGCSRQDIMEIKKIGDAKHIFSHIEWHMRGYMILLRKEFSPEGGVLYPSVKEIESDYALPGAFQAYKDFINHMQNAQSGKAKERG